MSWLQIATNWFVNNITNNYERSRFKDGARTRS